MGEPIATEDIQKEWFYLKGLGVNAHFILKSKIRISKL